jgi:Protein of unknown function (DUF2934)
MEAANDTRLKPDTAISPRRHEVERLAFAFWQERGAPIGTPDVDCFRAEEELRRKAGNEGPALSAVAKKIGSAVGAVAASVTTER